MRLLLFSSAVIAGIFAGGMAPATAAPLAMSGWSNDSAKALPVEEIGWRRQYRRFGYPVPYPYYPPAYGYYPPAPAPYYPPAYEYAPPPVAEYSPEGDYGDYPPDGGYGDYPPPDGY